MRKYLFIIACTLILITSCVQRDPNKSVDEGTVENNTYTSSEIGWTIEIPKGWKVIGKDIKKRRTEKGLNAIQEVIDGEIDYSNLKDLIAFEKNRFNIFQSTSELFNLEYEGEWEENHAALKEIIYSTYLNQGIKVDSSSTTIEKIDNLDFHSYTFTVYGLKGEIILKQIIFSRLINGFDFGVNINYNNYKDRDEMLRVFKSSKFKKAL